MLPVHPKKQTAPCEGAVFIDLKRKRVDLP